MYSFTALCDIPEDRRHCEEQTFFQTHNKNNPLTWAFCIFRDVLRQQTSWQEMAAFYLSRVAQYISALQKTLCFNGCIACMALRSLSQHKQRADWAWKACRLFQLWVHREPKRKQWQLLSPGDLPKPQAPLLCPQTWEEELIPLIIPCLLCADPGGSFPFSNLFLMTQSLPWLTSALLPFTPDFTLMWDASQKIPLCVCK